ncbi:methyltransferase domain-containing protein [Nocardia sp. NPDC024068]|uniref:methyltransferase domain-containing protein n=1 Tax=Nocardia sp. NPDC024068 TaxID=3157197 RepID=UPI003403948F
MPSEHTVPPERTPSFHLDALAADRDEGAAPPGDDPMALLITMLDLQAELPGIRRMREWGNQVLAAGPGERALDVGSGTGSEVVDLAARVGTEGEAVGVEPNPAMLAVARERAAAAGIRCRFVAGDAYRLPFDDDTFDAVRCERVYQHLDDPAAATAEIARVLRPGGRALLIDSDWQTAILHPGDTEVIARMTAAMLAATPNARAGRLLRGQLLAAGFEFDDMGSEAVIWDPVAVRPMFGQLGGSALATGVITEAEFEDLVTRIDAGIASGDHHLSVTMFAVLAHLPAR